MLLTQTLRRLERPKEALAVCMKGLRACPGDIELLFQEGISRRALGDLNGAEAAWQAVLRSPPAQYFASMHAGLQGYLTRHNLAMLYRDQKRPAEAEDQWRQALAAQPDFVPAWEGIADIHLTGKDWPRLEQLANDAVVAVGATVAGTFRARGHMARRDFVEARRLLASIITNEPDALRPRLLMAYAWLQEDKNLEAAERALRDVLALDPNHAETRQNLSRLQCRRASPEQSQAG